MRLAEAEDIPANECWDLLKTVSVGRLAISMNALPAILPVQYAVDAGELIACLGHYAIPHAAVDDTVVAFAADHLGSADQGGWSVQLQGRASVPSKPVDCAQPTPGQLIRITPVTLTGHRLHLCPFTSWQVGQIS